MKKIYQGERYKKYNLRKILRSDRAKRNRRYSPKLPSYKDSINNIKGAVAAPEDFRLIENLEESLLFFKNLRSKDFISNVKGNRFVQMSLLDVEKVDFGAMNILAAISDDLLYKNILFQGNYPYDENCKKYLAESGFLNHMFDSNGNRIRLKSKSDMIFFEKGSGILLEKDNRKIGEMVKNAIEHLTGEKKHCLPVKTLILEICGNSIEWGKTSKKQWLFGLKYEDSKVIFTVTDVGLGILKTLHRKFGEKMEDTFRARTSLEILQGAFQKKYNSSSLEINRNKGLPSIRINYEEGNIKNLIIITNDVILHYDNPEKSRTLDNKDRFKGTFYQWEMDYDCIKQIYN